jgi:hypothetical protein
MLITNFIHVTEQYSNAVLVAILPQVSDCASNLDLPIIQPITPAHVAKCNISPYAENVGGGFWLTNGYWFAYSFGCVDSFRSPDNWFTIQDFEGVSRFVGQDNMTTNDAIDFARKSFVKLGYMAETFNLNNNPTRIEGSFDVKQLGHIPFCRVVWESPESTTVEERMKSFSVRFDVDLGKRQIVGMSLSGTNFFRASPEIDVQTELESDYKKRIKSKMFIRTNVPPHIRSLELPPPINSATNKPFATNRLVIP